MYKRLSGCSLATSKIKADLISRLFKLLRVLFSRIDSLRNADSAKGELLHLFCAIAGCIGWFDISLRFRFHISKAVFNG